MQRTLYSERHLRLAERFRSFVRDEVVPHQKRWLEEGVVDRAVWQRAGAQGFLCTWLPRSLGGSGGDFIDAAVISDELGAVYESGFWPNLHSDLVTPYLHDFGTDAQRQRWLPGCARGELITAVAMTDPGAGSDLTAITTVARRDGADYVLSGAKKFVSNGLLCDLCIVAAKTDITGEHPAGGLSLFVVERGTAGFERRRLQKIGLHSQDTCEVTLDGCRVPADNRLGEEGAGLLMLMKKFPRERLLVAIMAQAIAEQALKDTVTFVKERQIYGQTLSRLQNTQFELAACAAQIEVGRAFIDRLVAEHARGEALATECSMAKLWHTEMLGRVLDACVQLFGGAGYLSENPVARAWVDARAKRIGGGTSEVLKAFIARQLGL